MNYYDHMLESKARQQEAARKYKRQMLIKEARLANHHDHHPRFRISFRLRLPSRKPQQPCPTCPEFA